MAEDSKSQLQQLKWELRELETKRSACENNASGMSEQMNRRALPRIYADIAALEARIKDLEQPLDAA